MALPKTLSSSPDEDSPFDGLTLRQARAIITLRPTWSERWRMSGLVSRDDRRRVIREILFERRREYVAWFQNTCVIAGIDREVDRFTWQERKAALQEQMALAHHLAERKVWEARRRREPQDRAAYWERKLNNGSTLCELRRRRQDEAYYAQTVAADFQNAVRHNSRGL